MSQQPKNSSVPAADQAGSADGLWTDAQLAAELGVALAVVTELRTKHTDPSTDFRRVRGIVAITESGRAKIIEALKQRLKETAVAAQRRPKPAPSTLPTEDLRVTRTFRGSRKVLADLPNGSEVVLEVTTSEHLQVGMVLKGCQFGGMGWYYHGRLPRRIGERQHYFPARATTAEDPSPNE